MYYKQFYYPFGYNQLSNVSITYIKIINNCNKFTFILERNANGTQSYNTIDNKNTIKFLSDYESGIVYAHCTSRDRTITTLQVVLASLFPP